jgi:hypothetical protein
MPTPKQYDSPAARQKAFRKRKAQAIKEQLAAKQFPNAVAVSNIPSMIRWKALHSNAQAALEAMQSEMQAYYDERSEQWQESDKGQHFQDLLDQTEQARAGVDELDLEA